MLTLVLLSLAGLIHLASSQCNPFCACIGELVDCTGREAFAFRFTSIPIAPPTTTILILSDNEISNISSGAFSHLPLLERVDLDRNQFSSLSPDSFDSLPLLQTLNLNDNPLQSLESGVFVNLSSLQELTLRNTPLSSLSSGVFEGLDILTILSLDDNQLSNISGNFLEHLPSLTQLSLSGNQLDHLPDDFFATLPSNLESVDLQGNPWSCDLRLQWIAGFLDSNPALLENDADTVCGWPPMHADLPISSLVTADFQDYAPSIEQPPQNASILTDSPYTLEVDIDGAPFPSVVWLKDGDPVNYTERVYVSGYDASLQFSMVVHGDEGEYSVRLANEYDEVTSSNATLTVTEATCVDGEFTESHETDVDCGGYYCSPCTLEKGCRLDRDCEGELVCLYAHQVLSELHYISPTDPAAYTCANHTVPLALLQSRLLSLTSDLPLAVSSNGTRIEIEAAFYEFIAETLSIPESAFASVSVNTVERNITPLLQLRVQLMEDCDTAVTALQNQIDSGHLKATARVTAGQGSVCQHIRLNF